MDIKFTIFQMTTSNESITSIKQEVKQYKPIHMNNISQMTYYLLPRTPKNIINHIDCQLQDNVPENFLSHSLSNYISSIKERITPIENEWDNYKKYINPYEFIHSPIPGKHKAVAKYKPLSRSYFKMMELIHIFDLGKNKESIKAFHLAEGPGGFIEAFCRYRNNLQDNFYGMTIQDQDANVPGWKKSQAFLHKYPNVYIENGIDKTGNILNEDNFTHISREYAHSMDIVTGDGGFDFSENFNNQEHDIVRLLYAQVCYALTVQKVGGSFVLKFFDCFMHHTVDLLYLLTAFYSKVYICKPHTSRYANSEKYIICKDFFIPCLPNVHIHNILYSSFRKMSKSKIPIYRFLNIDISSYFVNKLQEYNAIFGQQQLENISHTLNLINNDKEKKHEKCETLLKNNVLKCIQWCNKYNIETNVLPGLLMVTH